MISRPVGSTHWKIWLVIGVISITGCVVSQQTGAAIRLSPPHAEVESYLSSSHAVSCTSPRGVHMRWTRNATEEITATKGRIHIEEVRAGHGVRLFFENIDSKDKGNYTCKATVDGKEVQASFKLIVIKPIKFVDTATVQTATEYQNVVVRCEVNGDPEPTIIWTLNGKQLQGPKYKVVADGLYIENVTLEDKGEYSCSAYQFSDAKSNVLNRTIILKIEHKPVWRGKEGSDKSYAFISGTANLTCEVTAEPKPKFEWLKSNKTLKSQQDITIYEEEFRTTLQVDVNSKDAFGNYTCKASNRLGKTERVIALIEGSKPAIPKMSVHGVRHDSVQIDIEGPESEDLDILGYRVQYLRKQELEKGWDSAHMVEFHKGESPYILSGLSQNTEYIVRVAAWNAAGFSDYTNETSFLTDKIHADTVTGSANTATSISAKSSQLIAIIAVHNIISITTDLKHNL